MTCDWWVEPALLVISLLWEVLDAARNAEVGTRLLTLVLDVTQVGCGRDVTL